LGYLTNVQRTLLWQSANRRWYMKRGIPFRRGYFIHGPPKCGKTHWVKLLARHLGAELHIINLADPLMTDELLIGVFQGEDQASQHSVILIKGVEQVRYDRHLPRHQSIPHTKMRSRCGIRWYNIGRA
jgi:chaperone BCS1